MSLMNRAAIVLQAAKFGEISNRTMRDYWAISDRLIAERRSVGEAWGGPMVVANRNYAAVRRAAWARRSAYEVATAVRDLRERRVTVDAAMARLAEWVTQADLYPPQPTGNLEAPRGGHRAVHAHPTRSKRNALRELPADWMTQLWQEAADHGHRHLDALAILLVTGARPQEVTWGTGIRRSEEGHLDVAVVGAKVRKTAGQTWRLLTIADDHDGPAAHLLRLADSGVDRVRPELTPAALSMAVTTLGETVGLTRRLSPYDIRHQRSADVRNASEGDVGMVAAWLGHTSDRSARFYGRLARLAGSRGARPIAARTADPVRRRQWGMAAGVKAAP